MSRLLTLLSTQYDLECNVYDAESDDEGYSAQMILDVWNEEFQEEINLLQAYDT